MLLKRVISSMSACLLIVSCSACSFFMPRARSFDEIDMSHAVFALNANPQGAGGEVYYRKEGYVAIFNEDGSYQLVKTSGMFNQMPLWTSRGLFFSDRDSDYNLQYTKNQTIRNRRRVENRDPHQAMALEKSNGDVVNIFDQGFKTLEDNETTINTLMIEHPFSEVEPYSIQSEPTGVVAQCGQDMYGIHRNVLSSTALNPTLVNFGTGQTWSQDLNTLAKSLGAQGDEVSGKVVAPIHSPFSYGSSCVNGALRTILEDYYSDSEGRSWLFTLQWNTRTNEVSITPITVKGKREKFLPVSGSYYAGNDTFLFADRFGNVYSVDILTGAAQLEIHEDRVNGKSSDEDWETRMGVSQNYIVRADLNGMKRGAPSVKIWIFDRKTMKQVKVIDTPRDFAELMLGYRHLNNTAIAVKPDW